MMKKALIFTFLAVVFTSFAQKSTEQFTSKKLGEDREITIVVPKSYGFDKTKKYPLLVLLDGDYLVNPFQGALDFSNYWDDMPEVFIVAISQNKNKERYDDCEVSIETGLPEEKGNLFFEFIGTELVPYIEKNYRIAPFKIIAGHDTTAGFLNIYLYKETPLFDAYISLSPELPIEMENRLPERINQITKPIFYYHATADGDLKKMQTRIKKLDEGLSKITKTGFNYKFDDFKGASHYSLVLHAIPNALYQFFAVYQPITSVEFQEKIVKMESGYVTYLSDKYETLEKSLNISMPIRLNDFKAIEAAILRNKAYNEFDELSILARKHYPKSMLPDYHLALMFEKKEDYKRAQKYYINAFNKEPIGDLNKDMMFDKSEEMKKMQ
ncbi:histidine kinase [Flavobacterium orientale]|uniref:Histidine kinase n=2 Tax=Flavobacterium orientale TaxID=1756020 RepID=A0A916XWI1_9FLAO|nr:histidine kinase [Flavobacterium orientale]